MALIQVWKQLGHEIDTRIFFINPILLVSFLLFSLIFLFKLTTKGGRINNNNSPPSPPRLPIIGNLHQIGKVPHRALHALSEKYGPIMFVNFGSVPNLVISSPEIAREVMRTHETIFINRPRIKAANILFLGCTDIAFSPYGEYWKQARKICVVELLSHKRVQSFDFVREEEVADLVEKIRRDHCLNGGSAVNLAKEMVTISINIGCRIILGQKAGNDSFGEMLRSALDLLVGFCFEDYFPYLGWIDTLTGLDARLKETSQRLNAFLDQIMNEHQISSGSHHQLDQTAKKDFVDILLHLQNNGLLAIELTRDNIKAILLDMLVAGTDAAPEMEWVMAQLVKNPSIMKKAQEEVRNVVGGKSKIEEADINQMEYLKCVIKETLRLHSHFIIVRESTSSVTLAGYDLPPKTRVFIHLWAISRDPKLWDRPEEFLPERFSNGDPVDFLGQDPRFCPFGTGRRGCPGISYAVMEMEYVIANLLYWFDWKLPGGATAEDLNMDEAFQQVNHKKLPLILVPELHTP